MLVEDKPVNINVKVITNFKFEAVERKLKKVTQLSMKDTVVAIHGDTIKNAQAVGFWKTGHNARSIVSEVSGLGVVQEGADARPERIVDDSKMEGAVYSTSGYGGYGETGTVKMAARPYFKPALDKNIHKLAQGIKAGLK